MVNYNFETIGSVILKSYVLYINLNMPWIQFTSEFEEELKNLSEETIKILKYAYKVKKSVKIKTEFYELNNFLKQMESKIRNKFDSFKNNNQAKGNQSNLLEEGEKILWPPDAIKGRPMIECISPILTTRHILIPSNNFYQQFNQFSLAVDQSTSMSVKGSFIVLNIGRNTKCSFSKLWDQNCITLDFYFKIEKKQSLKQTFERIPIEAYFELRKMLGHDQEGGLNLLENILHNAERKFSTAYLTGLYCICTIGLLGILFVLFGGQLWSLQGLNLSPVVLLMICVMLWSVVSFWFVYEFNPLDLKFWRENRYKKFAHIQFFVYLGIALILMVYSIIITSNLTIYMIILAGFGGGTYCFTRIRYEKNITFSSHPYSYLLLNFLIILFNVSIDLILFLIEYAFLMVGSYF